MLSFLLKCPENIFIGQIESDVLRNNPLNTNQCPYQAGRSPELTLNNFGARLNELLNNLAVALFLDRNTM